MHKHESQFTQVSRNVLALADIQIIPWLDSYYFSRDIAIIIFLKMIFMSAALVTNFGKFTSLSFIFG